MARAKKSDTKPAEKKIPAAVIAQFKTILHPVITEKTTGLIQNQNKVTVKVEGNANKTSVKLAFEALYKVKVERVNIVNVLPRSTRRGGRYEGKVSGYKKAIVTLKEGEALDLFKE